MLTFGNGSLFDEIHARLTWCLNDLQCDMTSSTCWVGPNSFIHFSRLFSVFFSLSFPFFVRIVQFKGTNRKCRLYCSIPQISLIILFKRKDKRENIRFFSRQKSWKVSTITVTMWKKVFSFACTRLYTRFVRPLIGWSVGRSHFTFLSNFISSTST